MSSKDCRGWCTAEWKSKEAGSEFSLAAASPLKFSRATGDENSGARVGLLVAPPTVRWRGSQKSRSWSRWGGGDGDSDGHETADEEDEEKEDEKEDAHEGVHEDVHEEVQSANETLVGVVQVVLREVLARSPGRLALSETPFAV